MPHKSPHWPSVHPGEPGMIWWPVWAVAMVLSGTPLIHNLTITPPTAEIWKHIDIWAPAVNTALLVWLAHVQIKAVKATKQTKQVAKEAHEELIDTVKQGQREERERSA